MLRFFSRRFRANGVSSHFQSVRNNRRMSTRRCKDEDWDEKEEEEDEDEDEEDEEKWVFPKLKTGDRLGPDHRYKLVKGDPLRWYPRYAVWLAFDEKERKRVTIEAVKTEEIGPWEFPAYERLSSRPPPLGFESTHCALLTDRFTHFEQEEVGDHLCLVSDFMGGNVSMLQKSQNYRLPLTLLKRILLHVLRGITHMHSCGVIHTGLTEQRILFSADHLDTDSLLKPHPVIYLEDAMKATYFISNFVNAQYISDPGEANEPADKDYRPPELILKGPWNEKVDIWAFGCLIFKLTVSERLFRHERLMRLAENVNESQLWQIQRITGEKFGGKQLKASAKTPVYFTRRRTLRPDLPRDTEPITSCLEGYNVLKEKDVDMMAALLKRCLRVNPEDRATAEELLQDPFWDDMV